MIGAQMSDGKLSKFLPKSMAQTDLSELHVDDIYQLKRVAESKVRRTPQHGDIAPHETVMETVDNPYAHIDGPRKQEVQRSLRDDTLAYMHSHRQIDDAQFAAGRAWQEHYENSEVGGASAIDPGKEAVDGGKIPEPITDKQIRAFKAMNEAQRHLGHDGQQLLREVLGSKTRLDEAAFRRGLGSKDGRAYVGRRFRECLESLAILWGFAQPKRNTY